MLRLRRRKRACRSSQTYKVGPWSQHLIETIAPTRYDAFDRLRPGCGSGSIRNARDAPSLESLEGSIALV